MFWGIAYETWIGMISDFIAWVFLPLAALALVWLLRKGSRPDDPD